MSPADPIVAEPFLDGLYFGECPRWHEGRLWFSDFYDNTVFSASPDGDRRAEVKIDTEPAGLGWLPDGRLLVVSRLTRTVLRVEADGSVVEHGDLKPWATFHANDMVVDSVGRAYAGNFGFDLDRFMEEEGVAGIINPPGPPKTSLVRIDPDGSAHEAATDISFPNGTVITPDGRTLVIAESMGLRLSAFDVAEDGTLSNRRVWAQFQAVAPDGICLDADNCIWVANAVGNECIRVAEGGEVVARVSTKEPCYACMLGGEDRKTLYVVTAPTSTAEVVRVQRTGSIVQARVPVPGAGLP
jgi:sugar lactone lactonase YvrE